MNIFIYFVLQKEFNLSTVTIYIYFHCKLITTPLSPIASSTSSKLVFILPVHSGSGSGGVCVCVRVCPYQRRIRRNHSKKLVKGHTRKINNNNNSDKSLAETKSNQIKSRFLYPRPHPTPWHHLNHLLKVLEKPKPLLMKDQSKESAAIRTSFRDPGLDQTTRRINISKLLYLYIMGRKHILVKLNVSNY